MKDMDEQRLFRWWREEDPAECCKRAWDVYTALEDQDRPREEQNLHHSRLYGNLPVEGVNPSSYNKVANEHRVTWNVVGNVCDFVTNRIGKQRPIPRVLTDGGDYDLQQRAKKLDRFIKAQFRVSEVFSHARRQFLDAVTMGTGILHPYIEDNGICVERVHPSEIKVDVHEGLYGEPRQMMRRKWVSRDVLREMFGGDPDTDEVISKAGKGQWEWMETLRAMNDSVGDQVLVVEAWHLPSAPGASDGRHAIFCDTGPLLKPEPYEEDDFPFVFYRWKERLRGFWGCGLAEELNGIQVEINRMLLKVQTAFHLNARPIILVEGNSKMVKAHFTNEVGTFVPYVGTPPIVWAPQNFHAEFYAHLERLDRKAYEIAGITQDAATARVGAETSGVALGTRHDIETERFSVKALDWEDNFLRLGDRLIGLAKRIARSHRGKYAIMAPSPRDKYTVETLDWSDVKMDQDQYHLAVYAESFLPQLPGPRQEAVIAQMEAGIITDPKEARDKLAFPDDDAARALDSAMSDAIDADIDTMLDTGEYIPPEPYGDLNLAFQKVQLQLNLAKVRKVPEERLDCLRDYLAAVHKLQARAAVEQQKLAMAAGEANMTAMPPAPGAPPAPGPDGAPPTAPQQ